MDYRPVNTDCFVGPSNLPRLLLAPSTISSEIIEEKNSPVLLQLMMFIFLIISHHMTKTH